MVDCGGCWSKPRPGGSGLLGLLIGFTFDVAKFATEMIPRRIVVVMVVVVSSS